mmetsp:Transcript_32191/g.106415  ORF Transcript_32191/g.106415 Transcript_32191/m.106415 type:complete len:319 (+) Transcript_32191:887-1843(+)
MLLKERRSPLAHGEHRLCGATLGWAARALNTAHLQSRPIPRAGLRAQLQHHVLPLLQAPARRLEHGPVLLGVPLDVRGRAPPAEAPDRILGGQAQAVEAMTQHLVIGVDPRQRRGGVQRALPRERVRLPDGRRADGAQGERLLGLHAEVRDGAGEHRPVPADFLRHLLSARASCARTRRRRGRAAPDEGLQVGFRGLLLAQHGAQAPREAVRGGEPETELLLEAVGLYQLSQQLSSNKLLARTPWHLLPRQLDRHIAVRRWEHGVGTSAEQELYQRGVAGGGRKVQRRLAGLAHVVHRRPLAQQQGAHLDVSREGGAV